MEKTLYPKDTWVEMYELYPNDFPIPTEEQLKALAAKRIREKYALLMDAIVKPYTKTEQLTWDAQVKEADAYIVNNQAATPMLTTMATHRGVTLEDLVTWVKENEMAFRIAIGTLLGQQQRELDILYNT